LVVPLGLEDYEFDLFGYRFALARIREGVDSGTKRFQCLSERRIRVFFGQRKEFFFRLFRRGNARLVSGFGRNSSSFDVHGGFRVKGFCSSIGAIEKISNPRAFGYRIGMKRNYVKIGVDEAGR
jgi:hypothetical protein